LSGLGELIRYAKKTMNRRLQEQLEKYQRAEADRIRSVLSAELETFIAMLLQSECTEYRKWVCELSHQIIDEKNEFPVRMPLFEKIIFPVLYEDFKSKKPNSARWLSGYSQLIYKSKVVKRVLGEEFTEEYFLRKAIEHDPADIISKEKLIAVIAQQLEYSIHEVPYGVLWGHNGTSVEECDELVLSLSEFEKMVADMPFHKDYKELISECGFHFREYKNYLISKGSYDSYSAYLSSIKSTTKYS